ncbi:hypothetical protein [Cronobacter sakazakii]|uniref:hypothetical protein n=1 Tax=Cronobacter sakazakii TaxID=28141 RepID=UPI000CFD9574|nr:hypothetical protein [Cronobacter sakazakii]PQX84123.1 hypothetical protein C5967_07035 [Cronobacter sakazakii]PQY01706.1 hypothetical protein C5963_06735 [Cronobacter sakazakii]PQY37161.1 hypothetical protein C5965_20040 [Cronobacter sakazakii]PQY56371.1 hypothetical protein C5969_07835 [Cronobacter sakazakii]
MNNLDSPFIEEYGYAGLGNDKHEIKIRRDASCDPNIRDDEKPVFDRNISYKATVTYPNDIIVSHSSSNLLTIQQFIREELSNLSQSDVEKFFKSIDWDALS